MSTIKIGVEFETITSVSKENIQLMINKLLNIAPNTTPTLYVTLKRTKLIVTIPRESLDETLDALSCHFKLLSHWVFDF